MPEQSQPDNNSFVVVGRIKTVHGVRGWLKIESFTEPMTNILDFERWAIQTNSGLKIMEYDQYKVRDKDIIVHLTGLDDREEAAMFRQCLIKVEAEEMPRLEDEEFYWHQLQNMDVFQQGESDELTYIGKVDYLLETGANDVLVVKPAKAPDNSSGNVKVLVSKEKEWLIPYLPAQVVLGVDLESRRIYVDWFFE